MKLHVQILMNLLVPCYNRGNAFILHHYNAMYSNEESHTHAKFSL